MRGTGLIPPAALALQFALVGSGAAALLAPRADAPVLLVPIGGDAEATLPALALDGATRLIGRGALPGSLVVIGLTSARSRVLLRHGVIPLASSRAGCGQAA